MRLEVGDRVHYVVYPSGTPDTSIQGTIVRRVRETGEYHVQWDDVDYSKHRESIYLENDLAPARGGG